MRPLHERAIVIKRTPLSEQDYRTVMKELERRYPESGRRSPRVEYRIREGTELMTCHADRREVTYTVDPVDLSAHGAGVLHAGFIHTKTICGLVLKTLDGERCVATGTVVRCDCILAPIHVVGIEFNQPIDVTNFAQLDHGNKTKKAVSGNANDVAVQIASVLADLESLIDQRPNSEALRIHYHALCQEFELTVESKEAPPETVKTTTE